MKNKTKINNTHTETLGITEEIISTKQDIRLYYALFLMEAFSNTIVMDDEELSSLFKRLYNCLTKKMQLLSSNDIKDVYVVLEQLGDD